MADARLMGTFMTKARQREQRRPAELQGAFVTDEQQRLLEIEDMRPVVKFGEKSAIPIRNANRSTGNSSRPGDPGGARKRKIDIGKIGDHQQVQR
jgi:hypothetical protein